MSAHERSHAQSSFGRTAERRPRVAPRSAMPPQSKPIRVDKPASNGVPPSPVAEEDDEMLAKTPTEDQQAEVSAVLERQGELIRRQREDIEDLRKRLEENAQLTEGLRAKMTSKEANDNGEDVALKSRVESLTAAYNDIQDRLYEIDKSWKNNVVIYGIPSEGPHEEDPIITEEKVRDMFHKKLHISRDIGMSRIGRVWHGPDFRGHKPIQVCFVLYRDKEEVLRKARLLKGSNVYIGEDFSRKVREHRHELIKFMKEVTTIILRDTIYCPSPFSSGERQRSRPSHDVEVRQALYGQRCLLFQRPHGARRAHAFSRGRRRSRHSRQRGPRLPRLFRPGERDCSTSRQPASQRLCGFEATLYSRHKAIKTSLSTLLSLSS